GKSVDIRNIPGPLGVRGRNSDNRLIEEKLGWAPSQSLRQGMVITYEWIMSEIQRSHNQR
ncbi:MAG: NAD-dependent dehydratase, partial [Henriciella sp.]|nr:NAD-dependent dehydratase [Henriciella sp.]